MSETQSKPQVEVTEETRETLSVLELERQPRPEKMALENAYFDGAHEVRFSERAFKPRHDATLDEVRAFVDALEVRRRPVAPLPEPPAPEPVSAPVKVPEHYRGPLERAITGTITSVETVHRVGAGNVVDVQWTSPSGATARGLFLVTEHDARPYTDVAARVDELPTPEAPAPEAAPAPAPPAPPAEAPAPEPAKKKGLLGKLGKKSEPAAPAATPEATAPEEPKKKRFGFGKK